MTQQRWIYQRSAITRIIDGDTVVADIDVGFRTTIAKTLRLYGINTPEPRGASRPGGL
jgi:micrococcal nuclease